MSDELRFLKMVEQMHEDRRGPMSYTGVGSRQTPETILSCIGDLGRKLAQQNWVLRSGGTLGVDAAFERGCDQAQGKKEIFLP